jgi:hypothetical protein
MPGTGQVVDTDCHGRVCNSENRKKVGSSINGLDHSREQAKQPWNTPDTLAHVIARSARARAARRPRALSAYH